MDELKFLEFETLTVVGTGKGSEIYIGKKIKGNRIQHGTDILVGDLPYEVTYILPNGVNTYRLVNSNETLIVEKK
jgi:hypothetical protein